MSKYFLVMWGGGKRGIPPHIIVGYRISVDAKILNKTLAKNSAIYTKNYAT